MSLRAKLAIAGIVSIISFYGGYKLGDRNVREIKIDQKEVQKEVTQERVVTKILERPDGSKETIITEKRGKVATKAKKRSESILEPLKPKWRLGVGRSLGIRPPIWSGQISRRVLGDLFAGAYARTDGELGIILTYDF